MYGLLFSFVLLLPSFLRAENNRATPPSAKFLQSGDLIWPKAPGALIPYSSHPGGAKASDAARWKEEKNAYLERLERKPNLSSDEKARYSALQDMTYKEFLADYSGAHKSGKPDTFGLAGIEVGHVAVIEITDGKPFVIEAMWGPGVERLPYADWLQKRPGEVFWVGRLKDVPAERRAAVAEKAAEQIGKPYDFWNFDLADTRGFYCSKLAWLSILQGVGFPPDDQPNPKRVLWYSPKQLMHDSKHIEIIVNPGDYASD